MFLRVPSLPVGKTSLDTTDRQGGDRPGFPKTLAAEEIAQVRQSAIDAAADRFGARLR